MAINSSSKRPPAKPGAAPTKDSSGRTRRAASPRRQLGCWADSAHGAELLAAEVAAPWTPSSDPEGIPIASALVDIALDDWRPDVGKYRRVVDALVQWIGTCDGP
jgi:hypothetical protein